MMAMLRMSVRILLARFEWELGGHCPQHRIELREHIVRCGLLMMAGPAVGIREGLGLVLDLTVAAAEAEISPALGESLTVFYRRFQSRKVLLVGTLQPGLLLHIGTGKFEHHDRAFRKL